jgi:hypothetical protein
MALALTIAGVLTAGVVLHRFAERLQATPDPRPPSAPLARAREADAEGLASCERGAIARDPNTRGRVVIRVAVLDAEGLPRAARVYLSGDTTHDAQLTECLRARVEGWDLREVESGEHRVVFQVGESPEPL